MERQELFEQLLREYFDQHGNIGDLVAHSEEFGIEAVIEILQNRNGAKITFEYFGTEIAEDIEPEMIYE